MVNTAQTTAEPGREKSNRPSDQVDPTERSPATNQLRSAQSQLTAVTRRLKEGDDCKDVITQFAAVSRPSIRQNPLSSLVISSSTSSALSLLPVWPELGETV
ncbi:metal-sensing transcriptional repressor [Arthrobacter sp. TMS1-12-1]